MPMSAIIRCEARSCSAIRAVSVSSESPAASSREPKASAESTPALPSPAVACSSKAATAAAWISMPPRISSSPSAARCINASIVALDWPADSVIRPPAAVPAASMSAIPASSRCVASPTTMSASRVRSVSDVTCASNCAALVLASAPAPRSAWAMARAVASARGKSWSRTPMSSRAMFAARSSASPCAASRSEPCSRSRVTAPSRDAASSPSPINWLVTLFNLA